MAVLIPWGGQKIATLLKQASRHQSSTIGTKQNILTVNPTVKLKWRGENPSVFKRLRLLETIEWE